MSKESKLIKNTIIIAIGNMCTKCISFFMLPLYTSILSTIEYGTIDLIGTYTSLLVIIMTLQFEQGMFRYLVENRKDKKKQKRYITVTYIFITFICVLFIISSFLIFQLIDYKYANYLIFSVVIGTINSITLQVPRGLGDNTTYAISSFLSGSLNVILNVILVAILRLGVEGMLISNIIALLVSIIYIVLRVNLYQLIQISFLQKEYIMVLIKYSFPLIPYTLCWWIIGASDRMIIKLFLGTSYNGIYAAAYKFPTLFSMITNIFQVSWTESAAENVDIQERDEYYSKIFDKMIRLYSSANMGLIAIMPFLFNFLIGKNFLEAYYYIPILLCAAFFNAISALYGSLYFAFKETKKISVTTILAALINFTVNLCLISQIGLYAAAISSLVAYIVITIIRYFDIKSMIGLKLSRKYLISEMIIYIPILIGYYFGNEIIQFLILICVVIVCIIRNKVIILAILRYIFTIILKQKKILINKK